MRDISDIILLLREKEFFNNSVNQKLLPILQKQNWYKETVYEWFLFPDSDNKELLKELLMINDQLENQKFIQILQKILQGAFGYKNAECKIFPSPDYSKRTLLKLLIDKKWVDKELMEKKFIQMQDWYKDAVHKLFDYPPDFYRISLFKRLIKKKWLDKEFLQGQDWYQVPVFYLLKDYDLFKKELLELLIDTKLLDKEFLQGQDWYKDIVHRLLLQSYNNCFYEKTLFKLLVDKELVGKKFLQEQVGYKNVMPKLLNNPNCNNIELLKLLIDKELIDKEFWGVDPKIIYKILRHQDLGMLELFQELETIQMIPQGFTTAIDEQGVKLLVSLLQSPLSDVYKKLIFDMCIQQNLLTERFFTIFHYINSEWSYTSTINFLHWVKENISLLACDQDYISYFLEQYNTESIEILTREDQNTIKQEKYVLLDNYFSPQNQITDISAKEINHMKPASISQELSFQDIWQDIALYSMVHLEINFIIDILECLQQQNISLEEINRIFSSSKQENSSWNRHFTTLKAYMEKFFTDTYAQEHERLYEKFKKLVLDLEIFTSAEVDEIVMNNSLEVEISGSEAQQEELSDQGYL